MPSSTIGFRSIEIRLSDFLHASSHSLRRIGWFCTLATICLFGQQTAVAQAPDFITYGGSAAQNESNQLFWCSPSIYQHVTASLPTASFATFINQIDAIQGGGTVGKSAVAMDFSTGSLAIGSASNLYWQNPCWGCGGICSAVDSKSIGSELDIPVFMLGPIGTSFEMHITCTGNPGQFSYNVPGGFFGTITTPISPGTLDSVVTMVTTAPTVSYAGQTYSRCVGVKLDSALYLTPSSPNPGSNSGFLAVSFLPTSPVGVKHRVVLGDEQIPMRSVTVELIDSLGQVVHSSVTNTDGYWSVPSAFTAGAYTIRASVTFIDPVDGKLAKIINYPDHDPGRKFEFLNSIPLGPPIPDIVFPNPVLLLGGIGGGSSTWSSLRQYFGDDAASNVDKAANRIPSSLAFPMAGPSEDPTFGYDDSARSVRSHVENAAKIESWAATKIQPILSKWISANQIPHVAYDIIAHDTGVLSARVLATSDQGLRVSRVVDMDGFEGGTIWASAFRMYGISMQLLNGESFTTGTPPSYAIPSWNAAYLDHASMGRWLCFSDRQGGEAATNFVLPDSSGAGAASVTLVDPGWMPSGAVYSTSNAKRAYVKDGHREIHDNPDRIRESAIFLAYGIAPAKCERSDRLLQTTVPAAPIGSRFVHLESQATQSQHQDIGVDSGSSPEVIMLVRGAGAAYQFEDGAGNQLSPVQAKTTALDGDLNVFDGAFAPAVSGGLLRIVLTAGASSPASIEGAVVLGGNWSAKVSANPPSSPVGTFIAIQGALLDASGSAITGTNPSAVVDVIGPDGAENQIPVFDDGNHGDGAASDGTYGGQYSPAVAGRHTVRLNSATVVGSDTVERSDSAYFCATPSAVPVVGSVSDSLVDLNQDNHANFLLFDVPVTFPQNGTYKLVGELRGSNGDHVAAVAKTIEVQSGSGVVVVQIPVSAAEIRHSGQDGPYALTGVTIYDVGADTLPVAVIPTYTTPAYTLATFDPDNEAELAWLVPSYVTVGQKTEIVLGGTHFIGAKSVYVGSDTVPFEVLSDDRIKIVVDPAMVAGKFPGTGTVYASLDVGIKKGSSFTPKKNALTVVGK